MGRITLEAVTKRFGDVEVIPPLNLDINDGEFVVFVGPSGCGKSTLLRMVVGLEDITSGDLSIDGKRVNELSPRDRNLSMVFQQFNLWAHMTILQNVMEAPVTVLKQDKAEVEARARKLLDKVGIGEKCDVYPAQLSGGQQQRAAIARALAMEPEALLFDEPTSALDPELEQEVIGVIKDLAAEGRTMLIVTHDMAMARDVANHVIFLHQGVIEEQGPPETLFSAPKSQRLQQFLSAVA